MADIHNLNDLQLARTIIKDLPKALESLDKCEKDLKKYKRFTNVAHVLKSISDAKSMMKIHLKSQEEIIKNRGKV
jgi:mannosyltransferase OCH1-like enzyme